MTNSYEQTVEKVARAIADVDGEDYMEDYRRFDRYAAAAITTLANARAPAALRLPQIPEDDADFTPDLARKIIAAYQSMLTAPATSVATIEALRQARGALLLDAMVDDAGEYFGTTKVALEAIEAILSTDTAPAPAISGEWPFCTINPHDCCGNPGSACAFLSAQDAPAPAISGGEMEKALRDVQSWIKAYVEPKGIFASGSVLLTIERALAAADRSA